MDAGLAARAARRPRRLRAHLQTADAFLGTWRLIAADPAEYHPYWDLLDAVDWLGDGEPNEPVPDGGLERYESFVARTLAELG